MSRPWIYPLGYDCVVENDDRKVKPVKNQKTFKGHSNAIAFWWIVMGKKLGFFLSLKWLVLMHCAQYDQEVEKKRERIVEAWKKSMVECDKIM